MRRARLWIVLAAALVVLIAAVLLALPPIVRSVAIKQLRATTGRDVTLGQVGLNLFTRTLRLDDLRVADASGPPVAEFRQLLVHFRMLPLLRGRLIVTGASLASPVVRIARIAPDRLNVSDIVARLSAGGARPLRYTLEQFSLADGAIVLEDRTVTPPSRWDARGLALDMHDITTIADTERGTATMRFTLAGAPVSIDADEIRPNPLHVRATVAMTALDLAQLWRYVPPSAKVRPTGGRFSTRFHAEVTPATGLRASGDVTIARLLLTREGQAAPFVSSPEIRLTSRDVVVKDGRVTAARLEMTASPTIEDASVSPAQRFDLTDVHAVMTDVRYPGSTPAPLVVTAGLPSGGTLDARGTVSFSPVTAKLGIKLGSLDLTLGLPYLPPSTPITLDHGTLEADLAVTYAPDAGTRVSGDFEAAPLVLRRRGQEQPFVTHTRLRGHVTDLTVDANGVAIERLALSGAPTILDATPSPPQRIQFSSLSLAAEGATWPSRGPARVAIAGSVVDGGSATINGTVDPGTAATDVVATITDADLKRIAGYLPPTTPVALQDGTLGGTIHLVHDRQRGSLVGADLRVRDVAFARRGEREPFVRDPRLGVTVKDLLLKDGNARVASVRITGSPTLSDTTVSPARTVVLRGLDLTIADAAWPAPGPIPIALAVELPESGTLRATGTALVAKSTATIAVDLRDAALGPYRAFVPIAAPVTGNATGHLAANVTWAPALEASVTGALGLGSLVVGPADNPPIAVDRVDIEGLQVGWPDRVHADRISIAKPFVRIERDKDGSFPLRAMVTPASAPPPAPPATPGSGSTEGAPSPATRRSLDVDVGQLTLETGDVRFIDRSTTPFYSTELTRLAIAIDHLSTRPDSRANVRVQSVVGGQGALDLHGVVALLGTFFLDLEGDLRNFAIASTNPYIERFLSWFARSGSLTTHVHYRVAGDQLEATNDIVVDQLAVERARGGTTGEKLGVPLGLVVALLKNSRGEIRLSVPVSGKLSSPEFSFSEAIGTALRNIVTRLATAPFRLIGRVFQREGKVEALHIDPVEFEAGSADLTPDAQRQVQRVADFLRAAPYVKLVLRPVVTERDVVALETQSVIAAIDRVARTQHLDFAQAAVRLFGERFPGEVAPKTSDAIVARLRELEPRPAGPATDLAKRRVDAARTALVESAGIEAQRFEVAPMAASGPASETGRVEFDVAS